MVKSRDQIYRSKQSKVDKFIFDEQVASVFKDMISRSVPGYEQILQLLPTLVRQLHKPESESRDQGVTQYYDLGCSLGAGMLAIAEGLSSKNNKYNIIGIDSSTAMLSQAESIFATVDHPNINFEFNCADINTCVISDAALVLMNFTLQFIPIDQRDGLIQTIFSGLNTGGALIISEKIKFDDSATNQLLIDIHHQYKADQGYSQLEISQKRDAIENVLIPETLDTHINRLRLSGFKIVTPWIQNLPFISILAIK